jgi:hypothetical protein
MTFTDMSGHKRSEKNKLILLTCHPSWLKLDLSLALLYWFVMAWESWGNPITGHMRVTLYYTTIQWKWCLWDYEKLFFATQIIVFEAADKYWFILIYLEESNVFQQVLIYMYLHSWESNSFICRTYRYTVYMSWILKYNKTALIQHDQFTDLSLTKRMWNK